ncbi:MAG: hypothetical protein K0Q55_935 [Verrucomicrobia bacterium]|jgi:hypothetical protein|nr:hypothetical protein [Verrucomicrobiota bacterium]
MKSWQIYRGPAGNIIAVKEGFNFWAFFFPGLWAILHKLPVAGAVGVLVLPALFFLPPGQNVLAIILLLALMLIYGTLGNTWVIRSLFHDGWKLLGTLKAPDKKAAEITARDFYTPPEPEAT